MRKLFLILAFVTLSAASASTASADTACFDWSCDSQTGTCTFDFSCSEATPFIWRFYMDFGDGTSTGLTGGTLHTHTFTSSWSWVTLTIVPWSTNPLLNVTCVVTNRNQVGPILPLSGRCSS